MVYRRQLVNGNYDCNNGEFGDWDEKREDRVGCLLKFLWNLKDCLAHRKCSPELDGRSFLAHQKNLL